VAAMAVLTLAVPRVSAYAILFPERSRLSHSVVAKGEQERLQSALDAAISWWDAPIFFYQKENLLGEQTRKLAYQSRKTSYAERIRLIENGLVRGAIKPYKLARLARLRVLSDSDYKNGLAALRLSAELGGNLQNLYMPRFITLHALWPKMSKAEREDMKFMVIKAINYDLGALIKFAKTNPRARIMVRKALKDDPIAFSKYVRDYLRP
tara:strand:- start:572 stop:1198 length:627 start_codon:yes stop_codon:yes gene_type:complete